MTAREIYKQSCIDGVFSVQKALTIIKQLEEKVIK
jgi:hypothetical protein